LARSVGILKLEEDGVLDIMRHDQRQFIEEFVRGILYQNGTNLDRLCMKKLAYSLQDSIANRAFDKPESS
jgi:hypothetical protein